LDFGSRPNLAALAERMSTLVQRRAPYPTGSKNEPQKRAEHTKANGVLQGQDDAFDFKLRLAEIE